MPQLDESLIDDEEAIARHDSRRALRSLATAGARNAGAWIIGDWTIEAMERSAR